MQHLKCRAVFIFLVHGLDVPILSALKLFNETFPRKMKTKKKILFIHNTRNKVCEAQVAYMKTRRLNKVFHVLYLPQEQ